MTYDFAKGTPIELDNLRERLRKMSDEELRKFGKAADYMCTPAANLGKEPNQDFVIQLEEARQEWKRRMKKR